MRPVQDNMGDLDYKLDRVFSIDTVASECTTTILYAACKRCLLCKYEPDVMLYFHLIQLHNSEKLVLWDAPCKNVFHKLAHNTQCKLMHCQQTCMHNIMIVLYLPVLVFTVS